MLKIHLEGGERLNDNDEFIYWDPIDVTLEHSLVSISKWEEKYKRPYMKPGDQKTAMEMFDYIKMMVVDGEVEENQWGGLTPELVKKIKDYIDDNRTATTFSEKAKKAKSGELITSELIYCWMVQQQIPFECQYWHLSRLLTLINVVSIKNQPPEKQNPIDSINRTRELNKARRAANAKKPHIPKH